MVVEQLLLAEMIAANVALVSIILFYVFLVDGIVLSYLVMSLKEMLVEGLLPCKCRIAVWATVSGSIGYRYLALVHI